MIASRLADLRTVLLYPADFRIAAPKWLVLLESLDRLAGLLQSPSSEPDPDTRKADTASVHLAVDIGTCLWRIQQRLSAAEAEGATKEIRRAARDLESAWDVFRQSGIEVKNHTGDAYDIGMALRVIAFEPTAELAQEQIIETIKPTIYYNGKIARMGEVIVGTPTDNPTPEPLEHNVLANKEESHG